MLFDDQEKQIELVLVVVAEVPSTPVGIEWVLWVLVQMEDLVLMKVSLCVYLEMATLMFPVVIAAAAAAAAVDVLLEPAVAAQVA